MKFGVYAMRDRLTGFMAPTCEMHDHAAIRNFEHALLSGHGLYDSHPGDFDLFKIGTYNSESGVIDGLVVPDLIASGQSIYLSSLRQKEVSHAVSNV